MKIGIIVTGLVNPILKADYGEYADMIMSTLSPHGDFEYKIYSALEQLLPDDLDECQGYIITGSVHDAYADEPWINALATWIRRCDELCKPLIGICFGHQIINIALGGITEKSTKGWGIGMSTNEIKMDAPWMDPKRASINILVSHQDQVIKLPKGVDLVASSDFCPNFMFTKGLHILALQGHPEFSLEFVDRLIESRESLLGDELYQAAKKSMALVPDSSIMMKWFATFLVNNKAQH